MRTDLAERANTYRESGASGRREFDLVIWRSCVSTERGRYSDVSGRRESELQRSCVSPERERYSDVSGRRDFDLVTAHRIFEPRRQARGSNSW